MGISASTAYFSGPLPGAAEPTVLVLGGSGFIGRHAVQALRTQRCQVVIGSRRPLAIDARLPANAQRCPRRTARFEHLTEPDDWQHLLTGIDVVINCVGILRQRGRETYDRVHRLAPAALAEACRRRKLRLIHVSALGLRPDSRSRFLRSKFAGEAALKNSGADCCLVRPSLLDGEGGYGAKWLRMLARMPIHVLPADAIGRIAALDVRDLGEVLARIALQPECIGEDDRCREIELGGTDLRTLGEYVAAIRRLDSANAALSLRVPSLLARAGSHLCDLLHWSPFSFGHWELLRRDNCPTVNRLPQLLGHAPRRIGANDEREVKTSDAPAPSGNAAATAVPSQG